MSEKWDFVFDTRASGGNVCENPSVYYMSTARREGNGTVTEYMRRHHRVRKCGGGWRRAGGSLLRGWWCTKRLNHLQRGPRESKFELSLEKYGIKDSKASGDIVRFVHPNGSIELFVCLERSPRRNAFRASIRKRIMKVYVGPFMDGFQIQV
ncbi:hypothetical protein QJS10_CPA08g00551 [Acorus calamus]|uniref:DUF7894 domain-containing protein n=1 Tax=Acorus calamus TaxID=4465 RepID=A0AAV9E9T2_ACOCL|nr:hypothetical protein QJS10_CPA08g00551 [Acorus calamus]